MVEGRKEKGQGGGKGGGCRRKDVRGAGRKGNRKEGRRVLKEGRTEGVEGRKE